MTTPSARTALILGGARSGKSRFAEAIVSRTGLPATYLATAEIRDAEMQARISTHRERRGGDWTTVEEPLELTDRVAALADPDRVLLVDCLTLWLSNLMEAERDIPAEAARLAEALRGARGPVVLVSNEVGSGIVPMNALARRFADEQGRLNQQIAAAVETVFLVAAGLPVRLKPNPDTEFAL
ncbi:adenosylcobinamide kinase/adenosylcobinamide phosphate guanyltransferase [Kaistia sp. 32K]|uniref:bifunctional adenosylcobinamide kinase/adenosylcobinamide-phosphate guanylyltransferase n=1 Tax=Kaistia sp. 32K TaxID=2795690 RepID=UPI001915B472|nr:bifunctional adenosylcobinamide kinase/adenosylcobinamide-phosphate guanylyltransferase [Kaistia sp. 32K]BCP53432.1 adenosylcobinamide kinase/adenosylcobinamide phosphate guanyltransferase [Kaistia sp. 32K]